MTGWYPVAAALDVAPRHVFRGQLAGRELAIWRADDGFVNVWANRCLHRGVRLSIGTNDGAELVCRYHGWRYANRSAGCTYIPAHPADSPARTIHCATHPGAERYGLVWTTVSDDGDSPPTVTELEADAFGLRSLPVNAPAPHVIEALAGLVFAPTQIVGAGLEVGDTAGAEMTVVRSSPTEVVLRSEVDGVRSIGVFFVQPVDAGRSVIRPVLDAAPVVAEPVWRHHAHLLTRLVEDIEATPAPASVPAEVAVPPIESPVLLPTIDGPVDNAPMTVRVSRKWRTAESIAAFELEPLERASMPTFQAGDHIDVHLGDDLVRQYSLINAPGVTDRYCIGVKLEPRSRGGSRAMHDDVQVGDELRISPPRNSFPLRRNVPNTLLIAGGIGVTPILSMAQALAGMEMAFEFHYFAAGEDHLAFPDVLHDLGDHVHRHLGLTPEETAAELRSLLAAPAPTVQVYACGPPPMLDTIRALGGELGWPDDAVRFEYFENTVDVDTSSAFTVDLARSALTLEVAPGSSILDVVRAAGVSLVSSCEQGACGTCAATVLEGKPVHQDVYLTAAERAAGDTMLTCVSRSATPRLVLDL